MRRQMRHRLVRTGYGENRKLRAHSLSSSRTMHPRFAAQLAQLSPRARVLDCGGWFAPLNMATHVVDIMPYETRGGILRPGPLPEEHFTKATWVQADFLASDFRLSFPDRYFDLCYCSHTIEDLANPLPLLAELKRVSLAGVFVGPSRLLEQTVGSRDRMTNLRGHPHHHWILDSVESRLLLAHKGESLDGAWWRTSVPLLLTESLCSSNPAGREWTFAWENDFQIELLRGHAAQAAASRFAQDSGASKSLLFVDWARRRLRKLKYLRQESEDSRTARWWREMLELSKPYSHLPLR